MPGSGKSRYDFDTDIDESGTETGADPEKRPGIGEGRLGPMAKAIQEAGESAAPYRDVSIKAEKTALEMALELKRLRKANLDLRQLPLDDIDESYLKRDREELDREALDDLKRSIAAKGLSSPIRVDALSDGHFGLNQGLRRLIVFRELRSETGDEKYATIPAFVDEEDERESAYRRMVDENLIRENVTYGEMGLLAIAYAEESGCTPEEAVPRLFASAAKAKR
jgi:ParB family chromosome partitioning protein